MPPLRLLAPAPLAGLAVSAFVLVLGGLAVLRDSRSANDVHVAPGTTARSPAGPDRRLSVAAGEAPGAFTILPASFHDAPGSVLAQLNMPESEKRRLTEKLAERSVRLAAVTLWDTIDEDGDTVEVSAAGFRQVLVILHKPKTFFLPVQFGGTVRIKAVRDGGGGVTLGVRTVIGPVPLPRLAVGQSVEIPVL